MSRTGTFLSFALDQEGASPRIATNSQRFPVELRGHDVARGLIPGVQPFEGFGIVSDTVKETIDIWDGPTNEIPVPPNTGIQMQVTSSSASDAPGGIGVTSIAIYYLDGAGDPDFEIVVTNGLNPVLTVATDIRFIQTIHTVTAGTNNATVGEISVSSVGGGVVYSVIRESGNRSLSSARMVPRGKTFYLTLVSACAASKLATSVTIFMKTASMFGVKIDDNKIFFPITVGVFQNSSLSAHLEIPAGVPELTVIKCTATFDGESLANGHWVGWIEDTQ